MFWKHFTVHRTGAVIISWEQLLIKQSSSGLLQVISASTTERQQAPESLIIGKRKPTLEFQFQNKFRLGGEVLPRPRSNNVILRQGKMIGGGGGMLGGGGNNRYKTQARQGDRGTGLGYNSAYCDPCTDYLNNPMFRSLHSRWADNCYELIDCIP